MATQRERIACWDWDRYPGIGIKIHGLGEKSYPSSKEEEVIEIDTGFEGELLLPYDVYKELELHRREDPKIRGCLVLPTGEEIPFRCALAKVEIPQLNICFWIRVQTAEEKINETLIGRRLLKRFITILNGPEGKTCLQE